MRDRAISGGPVPPHRAGHFLESEPGIGFGFPVASVLSRYFPGAPRPLLGAERESRRIHRFGAKDFRQFTREIRGGAPLSGFDVQPDGRLPLVFATRECVRISGRFSARRGGAGVRAGLNGLGSYCHGVYQRENHRIAARRPRAGRRGCGGAGARWRGRAGRLACALRQPDRGRAGCEELQQGDTAGR